MIRDTFEYVASSGIEYFVEVGGYLEKEDGTYSNVITDISIVDGVGNDVDQDHDDYNEIYEYSLDREYDTQEEGRDFSHSDYDIDTFLKE